jgi:hypothetical protein
LKRKGRLHRCDRPKSWEETHKEARSTSQLATFQKKAQLVSTPKRAANKERTRPSRLNMTRSPKVSESWASDV